MMDSLGLAMAWLVAAAVAGVTAAGSINDIEHIVVFMQVHSARVTHFLRIACNIFIGPKAAPPPAEVLGLTNALSITF